MGNDCVYEPGYLERPPELHANIDRCQSYDIVLTCYSNHPTSCDAAFTLNSYYSGAFIL
jgi:hypothetical protein